MSKGFNLDFDSKKITTFKQEDEAIAGEQVQLHFELPNGRKLTGKFRMGQDVEWAKNFVAQQVQCQLNDIVLNFEGQRMPEFFSLSDITNLKNDSVIQVEALKQVDFDSERKEND